MFNYLYLFIGIYTIYFFCILNNKNKIVLYKFSSNEKSKVLDDNNFKYIDTSINQDKEQDDFLCWFSGFTDAEGNFLISLDRTYIRFRFKISLHIDDVETLNIIKSKLKVGIVSIENSKNRCYFVVNKYEDIRNVICPIFIKYTLHTSKKLDFENFNKAVLIKDYASKYLSDTEMNEIISLKHGMNLNRVSFKYEITNYKTIINTNWFIGFLEGEGTFGIKNRSSLYLQIAQKNTSQESLNAITTFLTKLPNNISQDSKILPLNVVSTTNIKTNVVSLVINSADSLYNCVLPYLDSSKMYTRKSIDFKLWRIALLLRIYGHYFTPEGKKLFLDISNIINKRYSTTFTGNIDEILRDIFEKSKTILAKDPIFDTKIPHADNSRRWGITYRSKNPIKVYIYEDGNMIKGSPFTSYSAAHKSIGLDPSSNTCNRYLDTDATFKNKYIFSSIPLDTIDKT